MTPFAKSSWLEAMNYDPATRKLRVKLKNGDVHEYDDVQLERATALEGADSPGRYLNDQIKNFHIGRKVFD